MADYQRSYWLDRKRHLKMSQKTHQKFSKRFNRLWRYRYGVIPKVPFGRYEIKAVPSWMYIAIDRHIEIIDVVWIENHKQRGL